ncbi:MAG: hypothetical protein DMG84_19205 [Acidobacteria bacterium]|nr:MAG: hypothetical protein DMG84_19205 [Acidobacteriota bacterium]
MLNHFSTSLRQRATSPARSKFRNEANTLFCIMFRVYYQNVQGNVADREWIRQTGDRDLALPNL